MGFLTFLLNSSPRSPILHIIRARETNRNSPFAPTRYTMPLIHRPKPNVAKKRARFRHDEAQQDSIVPGWRGRSTPVSRADERRRSIRTFRAAQGATPTISPAVRIRLWRSQQFSYAPVQFED